ncbi:MAG: UPF0182 family protein [Clostridia bacterium]|nr:UPF0182 family protein [Clostridia bacterium]
MSNENTGTRRRGLKIGIGTILLVLVLVAAFFRTLVEFITDYWWFQDLGYTQVFMKKLVTQIEIAVPSFLIITLLSMLYLASLKREYLKRLETHESSLSQKKQTLVTLLFSVVFSGLLTALVTGTLWQEILYAFNSTSFGQSDPLFGKDISFYVFKMALVNGGIGLLITVVIAFLVMTALYYIFLMSVMHPVMTEEDDTVYVEDEGEQQDNSNVIFGKFGMNMNIPHRKLDTGNLKTLASIAMRQLLILGILFFAGVALTFYMRQFDLLYSTHGAVYGAGFTDTHVTLIQYRAEIVMAILSAIGLVVFLKKRQFKRMLILPVVMILVSLGTGLVSTAVQSWIVQPDEINKESQYLKYNIASTQEAYDIAEVTDKEYSARSTLTAQNIAANDGTIKNIRINDFSPSKQFYNQTQSIRTYYKFNDVDVDRYNIDGEYTQTFLSAREMDSSSLGDDVSWLSQHIKYTHGYGVTLSKVNAITTSGQPTMLVDSIPPVSSSESLQVTQPAIYFGESTDDYIITNTDESEFDYPSGTENVYTTYDSDKGIKLGFFKRLLYAVKEGNIKILVSTNISSDSKILYERNVMDRIKKIAPFFSYDGNPYIVISESGKLYWIADAYTTSNYYPYSERMTESNTGETFNYVRNPVKVVVDAYSGETNFYKIADEPIVDTISKIYPNLIKDVSEMPEDLASHIRYSSIMLDIQARMYQRYHMSDVSVFYQNEDKWSIGSEIYGQEEVRMYPNYYIMKLPGEEKEEFISSIPFTPNGKKNMTGLLVARSDGDNYGQLILYRMPKERVIYGPMQIESQIDQNTEISKEFSLWNSSGSKYTRGDMFVIPIDDALLYVEPVYLESSTDTSLPEVKRVIVAYNDRIAYAPTLADALNELFNMGEAYVEENTDEGGTSQTGTVENGTLSLEELATKANEAYNSAVQAQKDGDWAGYGRHLQELESYLDQMTEGAGTTGAGASGEDGGSTGAEDGDSGEAA